ncbi:MAG: hypothetical protein IH968_17790 [Gemmatimonadetes bacterium]|nr:hypothetical protein [Gemmatimonadota bacterium]
MRLLLVVFVIVAGRADPVAAQEEAAPRRATASAAGLTGEWDARWASGVRHNLDGSIEVQRWGDALMVFEQDGDSVTGSWTTWGVTWTFEGTVQGAHLHLRSIRHDSDNPELDSLEAIVWDATLTGDRLDGYIELLIRGDAREPARRPWSAARRGR